MTLGEKLVLLRKELGLSQLEAAERLNISRQAISRWEVGAAMPSVDNLKYLSELYGVPVDVLLDDGQDLPAWRAGQQRREQEPPEAPPEPECTAEPEHAAEPRLRGKRWVAAITAAALVVGIAVGVFVGLGIAAYWTWGEQPVSDPGGETTRYCLGVEDEMRASNGTYQTSDFICLSQNGNTLRIFYRDESGNDARVILQEKGIWGDWSVVGDMDVLANGENHVFFGDPGGDTFRIVVHARNGGEVEGYLRANQF